MLTGGYHPEVGGGEALNMRHAQLLRAAGFDVKVLVPEVTGAGLAVDPLGSTYESTERWRLANFRMIPAGMMASELKTFKPHVAYFAGPQPQDFYGLRLTRKHRVRSALLYHADFRSDRLTSRIITQAYAWSTARRFDVVCATTEANVRRLVSRGVAPSHIRNVGMGVDVDFFRPPEPPRSQRSHLLFVGRIDANHTYKRLDLLIRSFAHLHAGRPDLRLTVIGDGDRRAEFEALSRSLGVATAVTFAGQVVDERLRHAYQEADLLVLPSPSSGEGFGLVVLEAYACGTPVVTSRMAGSSEVVTASGCGGLWNGVDPNDLTATIDAALSDPRPRAEVSRQARAYVEEGHGWAAVGARLADAIRSAIPDGAA